MSKVKVAIEYCSQCQWQLRAAWLAQELLQSFTEHLQEVALRPGHGGVFAVWVDDQCIWERKRDHGFPDAKTLKQRFAAVACPDQPLAKHLRETNPP